MRNVRMFRPGRLASEKVFVLAARVVVLAFVLAIVCRAQEGRKAIQNPTPVYPAFARQLNLAGIVKLKAIVDPDGKVKQVEVMGGHPVLVDAAVDAVKRWKYAPAKTETPIELEFHFRP